MGAVAAQVAQCALDFDSYLASVHSYARWFRRNKRMAEQDHDDWVQSCLVLALELWDKYRSTRDDTGMRYLARQAIHSKWVDDRRRVQRRRSCTEIALDFDVPTLDHEEVY